jgi:hypothetical protein
MPDAFSIFSRVVLNCSREILEAIGSFGRMNASIGLSGLFVCGEAFSNLSELLLQAHHH